VGVGGVWWWGEGTKKKETVSRKATEEIAPERTKRAEIRAAMGGAEEKGNKSLGTRGMREGKNES